MGRILILSLLQQHQGCPWQANLHPGTKLLRSPRARIRPHEHHAGDDAVLFRVTDAPLLDALGFLRSTW